MYHLKSDNVKTLSTVTLLLEHELWSLNGQESFVVSIEASILITPTLVIIHISKNKKSIII